MSSLHEGARIAAVQSLSRAIFEQGSSSLQDAYTAALLKVVDSDDAQAQHLAITSLYSVRAPAISREKREAVLDALTKMIIAGPQDAPSVLSIMVQLMEASNATAKISTDGAVLFEIAAELQKSGSVASATLSGFGLDYWPYSV